MLILNFFFDFLLRLLSEALEALLLIGSPAQKLNEIFMKIEKELFSKP